MIDVKAILAGCSLAAWDGTPGRCNWCGGDLPPRRSAWCSDRCRDEADENHWWSLASVRRRERDGACVRCGDDRSPLEVNHRRPLRGVRDWYSCDHHQGGLETLCRACHAEETRLQIVSRRGNGAGGRTIACWEAAHGRCWATTDRPDRYACLCPCHPWTAPLLAGRPTQLPIHGAGP